MSFKILIFFLLDDIIIGWLDMLGNQIGQQAGKTSRKKKKKSMLEDIIKPYHHEGWWGDMPENGKCLS